MTKYTYVRLENEQDDELIYRVCKDKELIGSWDDVKDILNDLLGYDYGESTGTERWEQMLSDISNKASEVEKSGSENAKVLY